jgi:hypothetical protein
MIKITLFQKSANNFIGLSKSVSAHTKNIMNQYMNFPNQIINCKRKINTLPIPTIGFTITPNN